MANIQESGAEESALKGKPRKKLHFIVVGILAVFLAGAVMYGTNKSKKTVKTEEAAVTAPSGANAEKFASTLNEQANPDLNGLGKPSPIDPNNIFPTEDSASGVNKGKAPVNPNTSAPIAPELTQQQVEQARLAEEAKSSKLVALSASQRSLTDQIRSKLSDDAMMAGAAASVGGMSDEDKALLAASTKQLPQAPAQLNQRQSDMVWFDQQRESGSDAPVPTIRKVSHADKYTIFEGTSIPAVTVNAVSSDIPGIIKAMVRENVYDGIGGKTVLIPKGSTLVGVYNNNLSVGQKVIQTAFTRVIFPNGESINIGGMPGADNYGQSGLRDKVDTHFWDIFGSSFLIAGIGALVDNANNNNTVVIGSQSPGSAVTGAAGTTLSNTSRVILQRNMNILPTIVIGQGLKFNVTVTKDISIPPYTDARQ